MEMYDEEGFDVIDRGLKKMMSDLNIVKSEDSSEEEE